MMLAQREGGLHNAVSLNLYINILIRTLSKQSPAVLLVGRTLAVVAEPLRLLPARFTVHFKTVFRTILGHSCAELGQVTVPG